MILATGPFDRLEDGLQRRFPRHRRAGGMGGRRHRHEEGGDGQRRRGGRMGQALDHGVSFGAG
jgi:hypothetical protein